MQFAYPAILFDCNTTGGHTMMRSTLPLTISNNQDGGYAEYGKT